MIVNFLKPTNKRHRVVRIWSYAIEYCTYLRFINRVIGIYFISLRILSFCWRRNRVYTGKRQSLNLELFLPVSIFRVWILLRLSEFQGLRTIKFRKNKVEKKTRMAFYYILNNVALLKSRRKLTSKSNFLFSIRYRWWIFSCNIRWNKYIDNSKTLNMTSTLQVTYFNIITWNLIQKCYNIFLESIKYIKYNKRNPKFPTKINWIIINANLDVFTATDDFKW